MTVLHKIVPCKEKKGKIERVCEKMGLNGFRYRGRFYSRFLYFFVRHYLIFTCPNGSAAVQSAEKVVETEFKDNAPRGPEYWGDLEEEFKTEQNREAAQHLNSRGARIAGIILSLFSLICSTVGMIAGLIFFIDEAIKGTAGSVPAVLIFVVYGLFYLTVLIIALCNSKGCFSKFGENTTIGQLDRTMRMHKAVIAGTCLFMLFIVGIIFVVPNAISLRRIKALKNSAVTYWRAKGVSEDNLKTQTLGELYTKLDKYGEFMAYTKANNK